MLMTGNICRIEFFERYREDNFNRNYSEARGMSFFDKSLPVK